MNAFRQFGFAVRNDTITTGHNELDCISVKSFHLLNTLRLYDLPPDYPWITRTPAGNYDVWVRRPLPDVFTRPFVGFIGRPPVEMPRIAKLRHSPSERQQELMREKRRIYERST